MYIHTYLPITAHGAPSAQTAPRLKVFNLLHEGGCKLSGSGGTKILSFSESEILSLVQTLRIINTIIVMMLIKIICRPRDQHDLNLKDKMLLSIKEIFLSIIIENDH